MTNIGISLPFVIVTAAFGSACRADGQVLRTETDATPTVITVTVTDYAFEVPDTLQEGWTSFRMVNHGNTIHAAQLVKLGEGRTIDEFKAAYADALKNNGPWNTLGLLGGIVGPPPNGSTNATLYLGAGHYAWYCPLGFDDSVPHVIGHDMVRQFVVTQRDPSAPPTVAPAPTITLKMVDYAFLPSAAFKAGQHVIRVENQGPEPHEVILAKMAPGKTLQDVRIWLADPRSRPPFSDVLGGVVIEEVGAEAYFEAEMRPGDYVLLCYIDAPDGRPHWEHGMIQHVRVD